MTKRSYVQVNGVLYERGTEPETEQPNRGPAIHGDYPDFVSPIDGSVVRGRRGIRDHCERYNVVPTRDLDGLTPQRPFQGSSRADIRHDIETVIRHKEYRY